VGVLPPLGESYRRDLACRRLQPAQPTSSISGSGSGSGSGGGGGVCSLGLRRGRCGARPFIRRRRRLVRLQRLCRWAGLHPRCPLVRRAAPRPGAPPRSRFRSPLSPAREAGQRR
jgi:hypothetical protein